MGIGLPVVGLVVAALVLIPKRRPLVHREIVVGADPGTRLPMVVALHGLGSNPERIADQLDVRALGVPTRVIVPRGFDDTGGGHYAWFPFRSRGSALQELAHALATTADRLAAGIRELARDRPAVGKPIVVGFSQGGLLAFALAVRHPGLVSSAMPIAGWLPPSLMPTSASSSAPPIYAMHGTQDAVVPYAATKTAVEQLAGLGWPVELGAYQGVGHEVSNSMCRDLRARLRTAIATQAA